MSADDLKPPTDEFGRDDPDAIERERRRAERERRRQNQASLAPRSARSARAKAKPPEAADTPVPENICASDARAAASRRG